MPESCAVADMIPVDKDLTAVETAEGAFLVDRDNNVVERLMTNCPTCGRGVWSIFSHIAEDCEDWPDDYNPDPDSFL